MFYRFNPQTLRWERNKKLKRVLIGLFFFTSLSAFIVGRYLRFTSLDEFEMEMMVLNLKSEEQEFSREKLVEELKRLNVKFPHIVMAQSIVETGNFKSRIFKENNNLFGMKEARVRVNTARGTQYNHAFYQNWYESLYDYAFYQCRYLGAIRNESEYFQYLSDSYAESPSYVESLKTVIQRENLKELFK